MRSTSAGRPTQRVKKPICGSSRPLRRRRRNHEQECIQNDRSALIGSAAVGDCVIELKRSAFFRPYNEGLKMAARGLSLKAA